MINSADPDQLTTTQTKFWIYTVCKDRAKLRLSRSRVSSLSRFSLSYCDVISKLFIFIFCFFDSLLVSIPIELLNTVCPWIRQNGLNLFLHILYENTEPQTPPIKPMQKIKFHNTNYSAIMLAPDL